MSPYGTCNSNGPTPSTRSSPPPYTAEPPPLAPRPRTEYYHESSETTSLVGQSKGGKRYKCKILHKLFPLAFILMLVSLWLIVPMVSNAVRNEITEWERVHDEMLRDIGRLREEKREILDDVLQLRADRDEQRREWELEREEHEKRRREHRPFWGEARLLTAQCPSDRFRRYEAPMYNLLVEDDWFGECMKESIDIAGRRLTVPNSCINQGLDRGVHGYWSFEVNTRECPRTIWDRLRNIFK